MYPHHTDRRRDRRGPPGPRLMFAMQAASLLVTGWFVWTTAVGPRILFQPIAMVAGSALFHALLAWLWSAGMTLVLYLVFPRPGGAPLLPDVIRTSAVAVWFAPATILLSNLSPAALVAALTLVVTATRLLYSEWMAYRPEPLTEPEPSRLFAAEGSPRRVITRDLATGIVAAFLLQGGVVAILWRRPLGAAALLALSAATLTLFAMISGVLTAEKPRPLPRAILGIVMTILLASALTVGGVRLRHRGAGSGEDYGRTEGPVASARELFRRMTGDDASVPSPKPTAPDPPLLSAAYLPAEGFPGVILWPEVRPFARLIAPVPAGAAQGVAFARPYSIPFGGEYWILRSFFRRPPANSFRHRGNPAALSFSSTDNWPLTMEAHQRLDEPIDLACCRQVRIDIWNADRYPNTVSLHLYSIAKPGTPPVFLGLAPVLSRPDLKVEPVKAVPETLAIAMPRWAGPCTELKVDFARDRSRANRSARIAIDRFVLVP